MFEWLPASSRCCYGGVSCGPVRGIIIRRGFGNISLGVWNHVAPYSGGLLAAAGGGAPRAHRHRDADAAAGAGCGEPPSRRVVVVVGCGLAAPYPPKK